MRRRRPIPVGQPANLTAYLSVIEVEYIGRVRVHRVVTPTSAIAACCSKVLINLHSGGFVLGSSSLVESIHVASHCSIPVVAVDYQLPPEYTLSSRDDALAVYQAWLQDYAAAGIGIYGSFVGLFLTSQLVARIKLTLCPSPLASPYSAVEAISPILATAMGFSPFRVAKRYRSGEGRLAVIGRYFEMAPVQALVFAPVLGTVR